MLHVGRTIRPDEQDWLCRTLVSWLQE
jgi:hypothetical protein